MNQVRRCLSKIKIASALCLVLAFAAVLAAAPGRADPLLVNPDFWKQARVAQLQAMLDTGADIHIVEPQYSWTPLHLAAGFAQDPRILELLLNHGANIDATDVDGAQPLHIASGFNPRADIVSLLLNRGASLETQDSNGFTPLHWAAANASSPASADMLLRRGANIEARSSKGLTPLLAAANFSASEALLKMLFDRGADAQAVADGGFNITDLLERNETLRDSDTRHLIEQHLAGG